MALIKDFLADFSRPKLFLLVFCISIGAVLVSFLLGGFASSATTTTIITILVITKGIWLSEGSARVKVRLLSLGIATLTIGFNQWWRPIISGLLEPLLDLHPSLKDQLPADSPSVTGLIFLTIIILGVNYFNRDTIAIKEDLDPIRQEFPEEQYKSRLKRFCGFLMDDLNSDCPENRRR
ncbi:MAG TPA: hypothetical protein VLB46_01110 [Pyrinomonadaceae bacterium]|nr:hypothetical protein [Pyrinomonadaceae bacterium]